MRSMMLFTIVAAALTAKADYWMTFCKTPDGRQYSQVGYVKTDTNTRPPWGGPHRKGVHR